MSTTADLTGLGMPPALAERIGNTPASVAGAGTTQGTATTLRGSLFLATPTASNTGFVLSNLISTGRPVRVFNRSATVAAIVYPPSGGSINAGTTNAGVSIPPLSMGEFNLLNGNGVAAEAWGAAITVTVAQGISPAGAFAAPTVFHSGSTAPSTTTTGTDTTPSVTEMYVNEIFIPCNTTVTGISVLNGSAVAGNIQMGLYSSAGDLLGSTASTAQSGTAAYQQVALSAALAVLGPAKYYVALQCNNTSARFRSHILGNFGAGKLTGQTYGTFPAITVPTTFTTGLGPIADTY